MHTVDCKHTTTTKKDCKQTQYRVSIQSNTSTKMSPQFICQKAVKVKIQLKSDPVLSGMFIKKMQLECNFWQYQFQTPMYFLKPVNQTKSNLSRMLESTSAPKQTSFILAQSSWQTQPTSHSLEKSSYPEGQNTWTDIAGLPQRSISWGITVCCYSNRKLLWCLRPLSLCTGCWQ